MDFMIEEKSDAIRALGEGIDEYDKYAKEAVRLLIKVRDLVEMADEASASVSAAFSGLADLGIPDTRGKTLFHTHMDDLNLQTTQALADLNKFFKGEPVHGK